MNMSIKVNGNFPYVEQDQKSKDAIDRQMIGLEWFGMVGYTLVWLERPCHTSKDER